MTQDLFSSLKWTLLELVPANGDPVGNVTVRPRFIDAAKSRFDVQIREDEYEKCKDALVADGLILKGHGRGGSIRKNQVQNAKLSDDNVVNLAMSLILEILPSDGTSKSNIAMESDIAKAAADRYGLAISKDQYQSARDALSAASILGKGLGKSGTIFRIAQSPSALVDQVTNGAALPASTLLTQKYDDSKSNAYVVTSRLEKELYNPLKDTILRHWTKAHGIDENVCEITAHQGNKDTGGKWTRPDLTLVAVRTFEFVYGRTVEVTTFEVKPLSQYGIEGIFETASHTVAANLSYLLLHVNDDLDITTKARLEKLAVKFGVGLVTFIDPSDWHTFKFLVVAEHSVPDPSELSGFLSAQLSSDNKAKLTRLLR